MGRRKTNLELGEIIDLVMPMLKDKGLSVPSFNDWAKEAIEDIRRNPFYSRVECKPWESSDESDGL